MKKTKKTLIGLAVAGFLGTSGYMLTEKSEDAKLLERYPRWEGTAQELREVHEKQKKKEMKFYQCEEPFVKEDGWDCRWEKYIAKAIEPNSPLLMKVNMDRRYWFAFFRALATVESGNNPTERSEDGRDGLLQLTYDDAEKFGCNFSWYHDKHLHLGDVDVNKDTFDPQKNLECGVKIMTTKHNDKGSVYSRGESYYWNALNKEHEKNRVFKKVLNPLFGVYFK